MQVTETLNEGLARELNVIVPKTDLAAKLDEKLAGMKDRVKIKGFRDGKVPMSHIKKVYGKQAMAEIVNEIINTRSSEVLKERKEKAAQQPEIIMTEDENEANEILSGNADFEFKIAYEIVPEIIIPDLEKLKIERPITDVSDKEVNEQVEKIAENARTYEEKTSKATDKDRVTIDYLGKLDGKAFDGGKDEDAQLILGSNRFIPGFEEQLVGTKAGDEKTIKVTFPAEYQAAELAGKEATFDITVKKIEKPVKLEINDELAKQLGVESADKLREAVKGQIESQNGSFTRAKVKRQILDMLDKQVKMDLPKKMVAAEFENIWSQMVEELERANRTFKDEDTTEAKAKKEYQGLAERRVRLGLLLAQIGESANVEVTEEELQKAIYDQVRQYPGQEQQIFDYFKEHPDAVAGLRAPIYEEKVVEFIMTKATIKDKKVSREELEKQDEA